MLPESLLLLLTSALALAQSRQELPLNIVSSFATQRLPNPASFSLPAEEQLFISVALCSDSSSARFFISNSSNSDSVDDPGPGGTNAFEIILNHGQGNWTGRFANGGILGLQRDASSDFSFDIALFHQSLDLPFFGDSTSNQALIFSRQFQGIENVKPTYPNYTLPAANLSQPLAPSNPPNLTLIMAETSVGLANGPHTGCSLSSRSTAGTIRNETFWAREVDFWRKEFLVTGLNPSTNYTAFVVEDNTKVSGPIYFATKSSGFTCPLVHSLPYCPGVAYAVPLPPPPAGSVVYDNTNLPDAVSQPLISYMANFTTSLTTFACGRDWYSPLVGCNDCQREYRKWLCAISFTRCSEPSPSNPNGFTATPAEPSATGISATARPGPDGAQRVLSALLPQETRDAPRNPFLPPMGSPYMMLQPCLEMCNAVDRACPPFLGFQCPTNNFNAGASYGVGYIDSADGDKDQGLTGAAQDRWGNVWCHMI
ncbi:hypothetical protein CVT24_003325 [Panaeolus cyanescens]|uniref:FZ domain-containing protein n=1 Tax=Panaeolus cyanescens TaxID=181874 RepID=A0A409Y6U7_9AGAR|nr:hypothetical protein CVT24_003325 [Panaeolus cyanescens]